MKSTYLSHYEKLLARHYTWIYGSIEEGKSLATKILTELIGDTKHNGLAMDLGCGPGYFSLALATLGYRVASIDTSEFLLETLNGAKDIGDDIITHFADMREFLKNSQAESAQLITIMGDTIAHLESEEELTALFSAAYRTLSPGGHFLISFRDQAEVHSGNCLVIPARSEENRLFVAALEFGSEHIKVTDSLFTFEGEKWQIESSSYSKLRLDKNRVENMLSAQGFMLKIKRSIGGLEYTLAVKN